MISCVHISFSNNIPLKMQTGRYKQTYFPLLNKLYFPVDKLCFMTQSWFAEENECFSLLKVATERGFFFSPPRKSGVCGIELNSEESVYYSVAICLKGCSQKSKYSSWKAPVKETF